jgi:hypothetical protein
LRSKEQLGSDRIRGTPGSIADKCGILTASPAASTGAASSTATATSAASGKTSPTTGSASSKAASTGATGATPASPAAPGWTASRASPAAPGYTRGLVAADAAWTSELALVATWKSSAGAETTRVKARKISLIRAQGVAHGSIYEKRLVGAVGRHLRREFGRGLGLSREIRDCIGLLAVLRGRTHRRGGGHYSARRQLER